MALSSSPRKQETLHAVSKPAKPALAEAPKVLKRDIKDYMDLIETVARVEYSRLPNHLIDQSELVNIGALALHLLFTNNPTREYNVTYMSTAIKWAVRNELRNRYKWYALKQTETTEEELCEGDDLDVDKKTVRGVVYETILSVDGMMEAENPHEVRDDSSTPDETSEMNELGRLIRDCMARLPERDQQVIEGRFFKNMRMREIGSMLGISPSRTSRVVQSALDKLKVELLRKGYSY